MNNKRLFLSSLFSLNLIAYIDADNICFYIFLGETLISWYCMKQNKASLFSVKAEYRTMTIIIMEIVWLKGHLEYMGIHLTQPFKLQLEMNCHYIREEFLCKTIDLSFVLPEYQITDFHQSPCLTKIFIST